MSQSLVHSEWNRMLFQIRCFLARCCAESTLVERRKPQIPVNSMRQTDVTQMSTLDGIKMEKSLSFGFSISLASQNIASKQVNNGRCDSCDILSQIIGTKPIMIAHMPEHFFRNRIAWLIERKGRKILTCTETRPCNFSVSPRIAERSVDFPEPTWPTIAIREPLGILSEILKHKTEIKMIE